MSETFENRVIELLERSLGASVTTQNEIKALLDTVIELQRKQIEISEAVMNRLNKLY